MTVTKSANLDSEISSSYLIEIRTFALEIRLRSKRKLGTGSLSHKRGIHIQVSAVPLARRKYGVGDSELLGKVTQCRFRHVSWGWFLSFF